MDADVVLAQKPCSDLYNASPDAVIEVLAAMMATQQARLDGVIVLNVPKLACTTIKRPRREAALALGGAWQIIKRSGGDGCPAWQLSSQTAAASERPPRASIQLPLPAPLTADAAHAFLEEPRTNEKTPKKRLYWIVDLDTDPVCVRAEASDNGGAATRFQLGCGSELKRFLSMPGIQTSYGFYSPGESIFTAHIEDLGLASYNVLFAGAQKLWVVVPSGDAHENKTKFEEKVAVALGVSAPHKCSQFIRHLGVFLPPSVLRRWGVRYRIVVQRPGQLVAVDGHAYHWGMNVGANYAEAINFASVGDRLSSESTKHLECKRDGVKCGREGAAPALIPVENASDGSDLESDEDDEDRADDDIYPRDHEDQDTIVVQPKASSVLEHVSHVQRTPEAPARTAAASTAMSPRLLSRPTQVLHASPQPPSLTEGHKRTASSGSIHSPPKRTKSASADETLSLSLCDTDPSRRRTATVVDQNTRYATRSRDGQEALANRKPVGMETRLNAETESMVAASATASLSMTKATKDQVNSSPAAEHNRPASSVSWSEQHRHTAPKVQGQSNEQTVKAIQLAPCLGRLHNLYKDMVMSSSQSSEDASPSPVSPTMPAFRSTEFDKIAHKICSFEADFVVSRDKCATIRATIVELDRELNTKRAELMQTGATVFQPEQPSHPHNVNAGAVSPLPIEEHLVQLYDATMKVFTGLKQARSQAEAELLAAEEEMKRCDKRKVDFANQVEGVRRQVLDTLQQGIASLAAEG